MGIRYAAAVAIPLLLAIPAMAQQMNWTRVDQALGKTGSDLPGGIHKYGLSRTDLHVTVDGVAIRPALALGGWLAFEPMGDAAMVMGDLVLTEQEINPVMSRLLANGITISALHNHLLRSQPATFYMHVEVQGDPVRLATALHEALAAGSETPFGTTNAVSQSAQQMDLDAGKLGQILGRKGSVTGGVVQFSFPRADAIEEGGMVMPPAMGTAIGINFQPTGGGKAAATGDFALQASEVNPVLQALRQSGIEVTALHNHMLDEQPRTFFVHFWANENAIDLAHGLHAALNHVNVAK